MENVNVNPDRQFRGPMVGLVLGVMVAALLFALAIPEMPGADSALALLNTPDVPVIAEVPAAAPAGETYAVPSATQVFRGQANVAEEQAPTF